jgi:hypothetical protein
MKKIPSKVIRAPVLNQEPIDWSLYDRARNILTDEKPSDAKESAVEDGELIELDESMGNNILNDMDVDILPSSETSIKTDISEKKDNENGEVLEMSVDISQSSETSVDTNMEYNKDNENGEPLQMSIDVSHKKEEDHEKKDFLENSFATAAKPINLNLDEINVPKIVLDTPSAVSKDSDDKSDSLQNFIQSIPPKLENVEKKFISTESPSPVKRKSLDMRLDDTTKFETNSSPLKKRKKDENKSQDIYDVDNVDKLIETNTGHELEGKQEEIDEAIINLNELKGDYNHVQYEGLVFKDTKKVIEYFEGISEEDLQQMLITCENLTTLEGWGERAPPPKEDEISSKVHALINILLEFKEEKDLFCGIVFCQLRIMAKVLCLLIKNYPPLSFIRCEYLVGHGNKADGYKNSSSMNIKHQKEVVSKFRSGRVNLLIATSVAEEGLDIKPCNCVIRLFIF